LINIWLALESTLSI